MLRPYNSDGEGDYSTNSNKSSSIKRWLSVLPVVALMSVLVPQDNIQSIKSKYLRRLAEEFVQNIYASSEATALDLPTVPKDDDDYSVPSYITLCQEWIHRDAFPSQEEYFKIVEKKTVCMDWTSPHYNMMDMLSASVVAAMLPHGRYRHDCASTNHQHHHSAENSVGTCDHTTLQQAFPNPILSVDVDVVSRYALKQQCKAALVSFNPSAEQQRIKAYSYHHPFLWPVKSATEDTTKTAMRIVDHIIGSSGTGDMVKETPLGGKSKQGSSDRQVLKDMEQIDSNNEAVGAERHLKDAFDFMNKKYEDRVLAHHKQEHQDEVLLQTGHSKEFFHEESKHASYKTSHRRDGITDYDQQHERHLKDAFGFMNKKYGDRVLAHHRDEHQDEVKLQTGHSKEFFHEESRHPSYKTSHHRDGITDYDDNESRGERHLKDAFDFMNKKYEDRVLAHHKQEHQDEVLLQTGHSKEFFDEEPKHPSYKDNDEIHERHLKGLNGERRYFRTASANHRRLLEGPTRSDEKYRGEQATKNLQFGIVHNFDNIISGEEQDRHLATTTAAVTVKDEPQQPNQKLQFGIVHNFGDNANKEDTEQRHLGEGGEKYQAALNIEGKANAEKLQFGIVHKFDNNIGKDEIERTLGGSDEKYRTALNNNQEGKANAEKLQFGIVHKWDNNQGEEEVEQRHLGVNDEKYRTAMNNKDIVSGEKLQFGIVHKFESNQGEEEIGQPRNIGASDEKYQTSMNNKDNDSAERLHFGIVHKWGNSQGGEEIERHLGASDEKYRTTLNNNEEGTVNAQKLQFGIIHKFDNSHGKTIEARRRLGEESTIQVEGATSDDAQYRITTNKEEERHLAAVSADDAKYRDAMNNESDVVAEERHLAAHHQGANANDEQYRIAMNKEEHRSQQQSSATTDDEKYRVVKSDKKSDRELGLLDFLKRVANGHQYTEATPEETQKAQTNDSLDNCHIIDFSTNLHGTPMTPGTYVSREWRAQASMTIHATPNSGSGYTPNTMARIFDSENPVRSDGAGDPDLGRPNTDCPRDGLGNESGGRQGRLGENCKPLGNLLIIQESDTATPNDNRKGGQIIFIFNDTVTIHHIGLVDIGNTHDRKYITVTTKDAKQHKIHYEGQGNNAYSVVPIGIDNVVNVVVSFVGQGAVSEIAVCNVPGKPAIAATELRTNSPVPNLPKTIKASSSKSAAVATQRSGDDGHCEPSRVVYKEDFENDHGVSFDATISGWDNVKIDSDGAFTQFLGRYGSEDYQKYPLRSFQVDGQPISVVIEFDFYEIDNWNDPDNFYIVIGEDKVTFGAYFQANRDEDWRNGVSEGGIAWELSAKTPPSHIGFNPSYKDQIHHMKATLNPSDYADGSFFIRIETLVNSSSSNRASGFDNFNIIAHYECSEEVATPSPSVTTSLPTVNEVANTDAPTDLPAAKPVANPAPPSAPTPVASPEPVAVPHGYEKCQILNFEMYSNGTQIHRGDYVTDEFVGDFGITITADASNRRGGFTPDGKARIFDTSIPVTDGDGDSFLGSPNKACETPGPGVGAEGEPGKKGENCRNLGKVLIVQEDDKNAPKDNGQGGTITFDFAFPTRVDHVGLMGINTDTDFVEVHTIHGKYNVHAMKLGVNSVQKLGIDAEGVVKMVVNLHGPGAVTELATCSKGWEETQHPLPSYIVPLKTIIVPLQNRLEQTSIAWMNATDAPPAESDSGCLVYIEPTSYGVSKKIYTRFIKQEYAECTSISVITTPMCMTSNLPTGQPCASYAKEVYEELLMEFPGIGNTGSSGSPGIKEEIACSTAGTSSRMMRARFLLCPPNTPGCLLPAMGKYLDTHAVLFETYDMRKPSEFFTIVGFRDRVKVVQVNPSDLPAFGEGPDAPGPKTSKGAPAAPEYTAINTPVDGEGFPIGVKPPPLIPASATTHISPKDVLHHLSLKLPNPKQGYDMDHLRTDPLAFEDRPEKIPEPNAIEEHLRKQIPLNINYVVPKEEEEGGQPAIVSQQLGNDMNSGYPTRPFNDDLYVLQSHRLQDSIGRTQESDDKGERGGQEGPEINPLLRLELWCPTDEKTGGKQKIRIPAREFKFSSVDELAKLCQRRRDDVPLPEINISKAERRASERRRAAAIAHATAKAANRPKEIRRLSHPIRS